MTAGSELERLVNDWLAAGTPASGPERVLAVALERVATTGQERHLTQRLFGDRLGRSRGLRVALIAAVAALLLGGAVAAVGSLLRQPPPPPPSVEGRNGWVTYTAAGDIYLASDDGRAQRLIGAEGDGLDQRCQTFGRDGRTIAYVESRSPADTAESWSAAVVEIDANGRLGREGGRLTLPGPLGATCPAWSPDLAWIAWVTSPNDGGDLRLAHLDGRQITLIRGTQAKPDPAGADVALEVAGWSPDGSSLAVLRASGPDLQMSALWIVPADGTPARELVPAEPGRLIDGVSWSPDGSRIGLSTLAVPTEARAMLIVDIATGEARITESEGHPGGPVWSPDGTRIAHVSDGRVVVSASDGSDRRVLPPLVLDVPAFAGSLTWSPDGRRLVVTAGDAAFVDRGVRFTVLSIDPAGLGAPLVIAPWRLGFYTDIDWQDAPR